MDFAVFYEAPVPGRLDALAYHRSIQRVVAEAELADDLGFHSVWMVEHHFADELSACSAPEVIFGHLAARTKNMRIGHGVRLVPHQYNNPIRVAEQAATVDLLSNGRLEFGTGRSVTRNELEGFGINPHETRAMQDEALDTIIKAWTEDEMGYDGKYWKMPKRRVCPKPLQQPHPPMWQATTSPAGHAAIGEKGLGLLSFSIGVPPEMLAESIAAYRDGLTRCTNPVGKFVNDRAATFTMVHCADTSAQAKEDAATSFEWNINNNGRLVREFSAWLEGGAEPLDTYGYIKDFAEASLENGQSPLSYDVLDELGAVLAGDPDRVIEVAKRYEEAGCELLLCMLNPYDISHEKVMHSIELIAKYVMPEFPREDPARGFDGECRGSREHRDSGIAKLQAVFSVRVCILVLRGRSSPEQAGAEKSLAQNRLFLRSRRCP